MYSQTTLYNVLGSLLLMTAVLNPVAAVHAEQVSPAIQWIIVGESVHLDRSSRYLMNGLNRAGIRHAKKALRRNESGLHQLIANHNLCIALAREGELTEAVTYCRTAASMPLPQRALEQVKPGLFRVLSETDAVSGPDLGTVIAGNIHQMEKQLGISQLVKANVAD